MATVSPSPNSAPSGTGSVPPIGTSSSPLPSLPPPPLSPPSTGVPPTDNPLPPLPSTPPQPSTIPPQPSTTAPPLVPLPNANPPAPTPPSPPSDAPPPSTPSATPPTPVASPPPSTVITDPPPPATSPPPSPPANLPSPPALSPPPPTTPPPSSPPPSTTLPPSSSPPQTTPPPSSSPPSTTPPSSSSPPPTNPPPSSSPPPATPPPSRSPPPATPPPLSSPPPITPRPSSSPPPITPHPSSSPPPTTPPPSNFPPSTTPRPSSSPPPFVTPRASPPPVSPVPYPHGESPPSPATPSEPSPFPPRSASPRSPPSQPPRSSPSVSPPRGTPPIPTRGSPPPSDPEPVSQPSTTPGPPVPGSPVSPPPPGLQTIVPSAPNLPANRSSRDAPETANNSPSHGGLSTGGIVAIAVIAALLMIGLIGLIGVWIFKRKKKSGPSNGHVIPASIGSSPRSDGKLVVRTEYPSVTFVGGSGTDTPSDHGGYGHSRSWITYQELYDATNGFSDEKLLGEGGFGFVYKGILMDGRVVAVKQLKIGGRQGDREFKAEVEIISRIHHRHLVSLVGYCISENKRLLVYEYVPNNTLHFHLYGEGRPVMDWATRVKIAVGAARGITYLHEDCHPRIIHRDIKSSNILLDNNFEARVADFGLAKLAMDAQTHVSTRVMGTFGYMAPEYATTGKLTEKSDVFSFGVVLLELITGRKPVDESQPLGDESLVEWARPLLSHALDTGEFEGLVDSRLEKNYAESEVFRMIEAAAACVRHSAVKRPRMGLVVRALSMSDSGDLSNGMRVGESQLYDSAQQSAEIRWFQRMAFGSKDISTDFFSNPSRNQGASGQSRHDVDISTQHEHNRSSSSLSFRNQIGDSKKSSANCESTQDNQACKYPSSEVEDSGNG